MLLVSLGWVIKVGNKVSFRSRMMNDASARSPLSTVHNIMDYSTLISHPPSLPNTPCPLAVYGLLTTDRKPAENY